MYTDKAYLVKDRFRGKKNGTSFSTLYRLPAINSKGSVADPDTLPHSYGGKIIPHCPPGLETLYSLKRVYLIKRLEMFQDDLFNDYKGELIDDQGHRMFLITSAAHHASDEVVHYGKYKAVKLKGKINYGALNHAGIQLFEIYGDPGRIIQVGPSSGLWGEIQVIPTPSDIWSRIQLNCCCIRIGNQSFREAEIRVVVLKKDNRAFIAKEQQNDIFKQVYTLRGKVSTGCADQNQQNFLYKKTFDLKIYVYDPFDLEHSQKKVDSDDDDDDDDSSDESSDDEEKAEKETHKKDKAENETLKKDKAVKNSKHAEALKKRTDPIGRICSQTLHEKLNLHLPVLEFPAHISVYDKLTLMGTFFLFNLKI